MKGIWKLLIILNLIILIAIISFQTILQIRSGSKVIYQDNIAVIIGTIQMPEANSDTMNGTANIKYPSGFTSENCVIISLMAHNTLHVDWWATSGLLDSSSMVLGNGNLVARLKPGDITISADKIDKSENRKDVTFKLVLMKLSEYVEGIDYILGDVNGDGKITIDDANLVSKYDVGLIALTDKQLKAADVNKDGKVSTIDYMKIKQYAEGTITEF